MDGRRPGDAMRLPWMRRKTHMRLHVMQGVAYRREILDARREADRARADLQRFADELAPRIDSWRDLPTGNVRISVEIETRLLEHRPLPDLHRLVVDSIARRLFEANRDYRGDLRQTATQRALGL